MMKSTGFQFAFVLLMAIVLLIPAQLHAQSVDIQSVTVTSPPATSCTNTSITVSGMLSAANYIFLGETFSVVGNTINVDVEYTAGIIILPAFVPFSHSINVGMLPAGTYTINATSTFFGNPDDAMTANMTVVGCCGAVPSFTATSTSGCPGDSVSFTNTSTASDLYAWSVDGVFANNSTDFGMTFSTAGQYAVQLSVTDTTAACSDSTTVVVTINANPVINLGNDTTGCLGVASVLNPGSFSTYAWSDGSTGSTLDVSSVGTYWVNVTDANGCGASDTIEFTGFLAVTDPLLTSSQAAICFGTTETLEASATADSYLWSNGATTQSITVSGGNYTVTVTLAGECPGVDSVWVEELSEPFSGLPDDTTGCGQILLETYPLLWDWSWNTGETTPNIVVPASGTFSLEFTDVNGCYGTHAVVVTVNEIPVIDLGGSAILCNGSSITLEAGTSDETYLWNTGDTTNTITVDSAGSYSCAVTNAAGCVGTDTIEVSIGTELPVMLGADTTICNGESLTLDATFAGSTYVWSNASTAATLLVGAPGIYSVTVTNNAGCIGTDSIEVEYDPCLGIWEQTTYPGISAWPNPTSGQMVISLPDEHNIQFLVVTNVAGAVVLTKPVHTRDTQVIGDLSVLPAGLYFLRANGDKPTQVIKVIRQ